MLHDGQSFQGKAVQVPPGDYDYPHVAGIGNKKLASIVVPAGVRVTLFDRPEFSGERIVYQGPMNIPYLSTAWNERVTSIRVELI